MDTVFGPAQTQWTPINETGLQQRIKAAVARIPERQKALWELIRLPSPEIWEQHPWADEGCGFWVVATYGRCCVYFNDVTHGFAVSRFKRWGNIDHFETKPDELDDILSELVQNDAEIVA
ncbi:hypothetical protein [Oceanobacter kriegii]|uniref:hypothetical protein n=1 Tax=Oceanobacter kriegii TaxID=64972 RepID=UPI000402A759|nr:hypothetical protein [Oceanobacter kriegii]